MEFDKTRWSCPWNSDQNYTKLCQGVVGGSRGCRGGGGPGGQWGRGGGPGGGWVGGWWGVQG